MPDVPPFEPGYPESFGGSPPSNGNGTAPKRRATDAPAWNENAEQAVVGAMMMDQSVIAEVRRTLEPTSFFGQTYRVLFEAMRSMADAGERIDPLTLSHWLRSHGAGDMTSDVAYLIDAVPTSANVSYHARIVREHADRRAFSIAIERLRTAASDPALDPRALAAELLEQLALADRSSGLPQATCALDAPPQEPVTWCIEDLWTKGDIGLIVGDGGSFKSSAALHMACAIAGGYRVFGYFPVVERRPVLIVSAEDVMGVVLMRIESFIEGHGWNREKVMRNLHIFATPDVTLSDPRWQAHLLAEAKRIGPGFIVLDPLADLLGGDENANTDVRPVMKFARQLAAVCGSATAIVHHAGKAGSDKRTLDRIRGASAINAAARVILFFEFRPDGVRVENLKMTKAAKLEPFMVKREIHVVPGNRAMWTSAELSYQTAKEHMRTKGEAFILARLRSEHPNRMNTSALRSAGAEASPFVSPEEITIGLRTLQADGQIDFIPAPRGAKLWGFLDRTVTGQREET